MNIIDQKSFFIVSGSFLIINLFIFAADPILLTLNAFFFSKTLLLMFNGKNFYTLSDFFACISNYPKRGDYMIFILM